MLVGGEDESHFDICAEYLNTDNDNEILTAIEFLSLHGRIYTKYKRLTFWEYPSSKTELNRVISDINKEAKTKNLPIHIDNNWEIELETYSKFKKDIDKYVIPISKYINSTTNYSNSDKNKDAEDREMRPESFISIKSIIKEDILLSEHKQFCSLVDSYLQSSLKESFLDNMKSWFKDKFDFIKELATIAKLKFEDLLILFKNTKVYKLFSLIGWSLTKVFELVKSGYKYYQKLIEEIHKFMASNKIVRWTTDNLEQLDKFLQSNPILKHLGGVAVAGLLLYLFFNVGSTGDIETDFGLDNVLYALQGHYNLASIFGGENGMKLITTLTMGMLGLSFPWSTSTTSGFISALIYTLGKITKSKIHKK